MSTWDNHRPEMATGPGDVRAAERDAAIATVSGRLANIAACYTDLANASHAAATGNAGVRVAVSKTPPVPVDVDRVDLTGPANPGSVHVAAGSPWPEDQIGHVAVQSELTTHAAGWAAERNEWTPRGTVPELCQWLDDRLDWAYDNPTVAWDEVADRLHGIARALYGTLSPRTGKVVPVSAPCVRDDCEGVLGRREDGWIECGDPDCRRILSATEYEGWAADVIHKEANGGWGITAREIQLATGWPAGAIRRYVIEYGLTKTGPEQRPTLYSREEFEQARPKIEAKRKAWAEREAARAA